MNQKTLLAAGLALACSLSAPVFAADTIIFDPDGLGGANGAYSVGTFDWLPGSTLSVDAIPTQQSSEFDAYSHAALGDLLDSGGVSIPALTGLNSTFEITFIAGFKEIIDSVSAVNVTLVTDGGDGVGVGGNDVYRLSQTITLSEAADQSLSFFQIYYDDLSGLTKSNPLAGTGYNDGDLILEGSLVALNGNFTTVFEFTDVDNSGDLTDGDETTLLDQNADGDQWNGQQTVSGVGTTDLVANVTFQDPNFFITNISTILTELFFNTSNVLPFRSTNPSQSFDDGLGGTISPNVGPVDVNGDPIGINGFSGPDILFQTDANNSFETTTEVPEPNTVLLFALGLLFLGFVSRSRYLTRS